MTAEVSFAATFLSTLDTKPIKLAADYALDPRSLEITFPYTLPRGSNAKPMTRIPKTSTSISSTSASNPTSNAPIPAAATAAAAQGAPGSEAAISVTLKSAKNPPLDLKLPAEPLSTSVLQLKQRVAREVGLGSVEKIRLLWRKKPVGDIKTLKEISGSEGGGRGLEFGVMVLGGVPEKSAEPVAPVAQGESGVQVLRTEVFWEDLRGFLEQRVRDRKVAAEASRLFREAWEKRC